jgi:chromosome segregation ATPase
MSGASYRRGSQAISAQIDRDLKHPKTAIERAFADGLSQGRHEADAEIAALQERIKQHRAHIKKLRVYLRAEKERVPRILERLQDFRESFRGTGASGKYWAALIAYKRALEAA